MGKFLIRPKTFAGPVDALVFTVVMLCFMGDVFAAPIKGEKAFDTRPLSTETLEAEKAVSSEKDFNGSPLKIYGGKVTIYQEKDFDNRRLLRPSHEAKKAISREKDFDGSPVRVVTVKTTISQEKDFDNRRLLRPTHETKKAISREKDSDDSPVRVVTVKTTISQEKDFDNRRLLRSSYVADALSLDKEFIAPEEIVPSMLISDTLAEDSPKEKGFTSSVMTAITKAKEEEAGYLLSEQEQKKLAYSEEERLRELEKVFGVVSPEVAPPKVAPSREGSLALEEIEAAPPREKPVSPPAPDFAEGLSTNEKVVYHFNMGVFYQKQGDILRAIEEYERVLEIDPYNAEVHNNLGVIYKERGDLDKAVEHYQLVVSLNPGMEEAHNNLGVIYYLRGNHKAATSEYKKVLQINPDNLVSRINLGIVYKAQGLEQKAIDTFEEVLAVDPSNPEASYNLAILYEELVHLEEAIWYYTRFIYNANNDHPELVKRVARRIEDLKVTSGEILRE